MKAIIPIQELIKDGQLDISPDTEVIGSILKHLVVIKVHQDQVAALLLIVNPQPPVQSTVQMTSTLCLIHVMMSEFVLQSSAHHLIDVIIINMINVIIYNKRHHQHEKHLSPERSCHRQDRQIYEIKSLPLAETNSCKRDNLAEHSLPMLGSEDRNKTYENRVRSTRMLKVEQDPPFTNAFVQEC